LIYRRSNRPTSPSGTPRHGPGTSSCSPTAARIRATTKGWSEDVRGRITVSTVAVGPSADPELLKNLAQWGKGRAYAVATPRRCRRSS
jgi:hypothetical protein